MKIDKVFNGLSKNKETIHFLYTGGTKHVSKHCITSVNLQKKSLLSQ